MKIPSCWTAFGFTWGPVEVICGFTDEKKGWVTLFVETARYKLRNRIQITVTKNGMVRIYGPTGEWLPKS